MITIKLKRAYEPYTEGDGIRILVDRLWPRGVDKESLHYNVWEKDLAPSTDLRNWFHEDPEHRWQEFIDKYLDELEKSNHLAAFINKIKHYNTITLVYAAKDEAHNNALVLKELLDKKMTEIAAKCKY